jgi:uncharacterized protein (TIGR02391 family)
MTLASEIDEALYSEIMANYEKGNYTGAILDSIMHLCSTIRERTDLQSDGVALIGSAFGGNNPPLKVTQMRNQSERDIQKGIGNLLRGIIEAIRNPRSHVKMTDTVEDADAIILFIDYILRQINKAKAPFTLDDYVARVLEKDFVATTEYSELLVDDIPEGKIYEVIVEVYNRKEQGKAHSLSVFYSSALKRLSAEDEQAFLSMVGEELKTTNNEQSIKAIVAILGDSYWGRIDRVVRIRIEHKLIRSVAQGTYSKAANRCTAGSLGTWLLRIINVMVCRADFRHALIQKLSSRIEFEQDYIFHFFGDYILEPDEKPEEDLIEFMKQSLAAGDMRVFELLLAVFATEPPDWAKGLRKEFDEFSPAEESDDFPF